MTNNREGTMKSLAIVTLALLAATPALAQQGVTANEIVIGTAQDLSDRSSRCPSRP